MAPLKRQSNSNRRSETKCPLLGHPKPYPRNRLPSKGEVINHYLFLRQKNLFRNSVNINEITRKVAVDLQIFWRDYASVTPVESIDDIMKQIKKLYKDFYLEKAVRWVRKNKASIDDLKCSDHVISRLNEYRTELNKLFDIAQCKSMLGTDCTCSTCKQMVKGDVVFLHEQGSSRVSKIGRSIDRIGSSELQGKIEKLQRKIKRKQKTIDRLKRKRESNIIKHNFVGPESDHSAGDEEENDKSDPDFVPFPPEQSQRLNLPLNDFVMCSVAKGVSQQTTTDQYNTFVRGMGGSLKDMISRFKVQTAMDKVRDNARDEAEDEMRNSPPIGIYFDGKITVSVRCIRMPNGKMSRKAQPVEHYTILIEPGGRFCVSITIPDDKGDKAANIIAKEIARFFKDTGIPIEHSILVLGCDGCSVNMGVWTGVVRRLELLWGKAIQHIVCLFHFNELPLKALIRTFIGTTNGKRGNRGLLGEEIQREDLNTLKVVDYKLIEMENGFPFPDCSEEFLKERGIRQDQMHLYHLCRGLITGSLKDGSNESEAIMTKTLPKTSNARWLITATRICHRFATCANPEEFPNLRQLTIFIVRVYVPMFFCIRTEPYVDSGSRHFHDYIRRTRYLATDWSEEALSVVNKVILTNAYFGHLENIVISMLTDSNEEIKTKAIKLIEDARILKMNNQNYCSSIFERKAKSPKLIITRKIRYFKLPIADELNFDASHYSELVTLIPIEPPMVVGVDDLLNYKCPLFPNHSQAVEKYVQDVSHEAKRVTTDNRRNGNIHVKNKFKPFSKIKLRGIKSKLSQVK